MEPVIDPDYNESRNPIMIMVHIYQEEEGWIVKGEGTPFTVHSTRAKAMKAARQILRDAGSGRLVVLGPTGRILETGQYRMPKIKRFEDKSTIGRERIEEVIGGSVLRELKSERLSISA